MNLEVQVEMNKSNTTKNKKTKQIDAIVYCSYDGKSGRVWREISPTNCLDLGNGFKTTM